MTQPDASRRGSRRRVLLTLLLLLIAAGAIIVAAATNSLQNAPIRLGQSDTAEATPDITAEAGDVTLDDLLAYGETPIEIPTGTPPRAFTFISNRAGSWDIVSLEADGTLANLTTEGDGPTAGDYFSSWSLDGARINFLSNRTGEVGPTQINPDGGNPRSLDILSAVMSVVGEGRLDWDAAWSPGGERLLWSSLRDLNLELYVIEADAEFTPDNAIRLTQNGARDWFAGWSPDGETVIFASDREGNEDIYTVPASGGDVVMLTESEWDELHPVWSMDGAQILYIYDEEDALEDGVLTLYLMDADGSDPRPLEDAVFTGDPTYSPDGETVLLMSNAEGLWNIYAMNADGSNLRRLTPNDADDLFPVWRP